MSCSNCNNQGCNGGSSCGGATSASCVSQLSLGISPNSCTLCGSLNGVPIVPVDLGPAIKECETTTRLRFDTDNCALRYENEDYAESGVADVIYVCDMLRCSTLSCLGDVCDIPASNCDILVWNETDHNWCPYTIPDDTIVTIVGVNAEGCLVKDDNLSCVIGQAIPAGVALSLVGLDAANCLVEANAAQCTMPEATAGGVVFTNNMYAIVQPIAPVPLSPDWAVAPGPFVRTESPFSMGSATYTNTDTCDRFVRIDVHLYPCYNAIAAGYSVGRATKLTSSVADLNGNIFMAGWSHSNGSGIFGAFPVNTFFQSATMTVRLAPGAAVSWECHSYSVNYTGNAHLANEATAIIPEPDAGTGTWNIISWRAK